MPNKDGTGPEGKGPKTGRQLGNCEGAIENDCPRRRGKRFGFRRGFRKQDE